MDFFESSHSELHDFNMNKLNVDEAYLNLTSTLDTVVRVYSLSSDCKECPFTYVSRLNRSSHILRVSTKFDSTWRFYDEKSIFPYDTYIPADNKEFLCQIDEDFGQFGIYDITVRENNCDYVIRQEPVNIYLPLLFVTFLLLSFYVCASLYQKLCRKKAAPDDELLILSVSTKSSRTRSIDTFRGLALCLMMFVNDGGAGYWFFEHTTWGGCYPADLLYPWFLWIVGLCIPISQKNSSSHGKFTLIMKILQRTAILFLLGILFNSINSGPINLSMIRALGILQRIALCYGVVSIISVLVWRSQVSNENVRTFSASSSSTKFLRLWLIYLCILGIHYYFTYYFPVPGCPPGYLGPGGIHHNGAYAECTGGATGYIDRLLLGNDHMTNLYYAHITYRTSVPFDPENILGTLTAIFQTFLGTQAGFILCMRTNSPAGKIRLLLICGGLALMLGLILHYSNMIPINKKLWTLSFVLTTSGLAFLLFAALYYFIDYAHVWDGTPFFYPGTNSILVFVGHRVCQSLFPWHWRIASMNTHFLLLVENIWGVILWVLITRKLYKKSLLFNV